MLAAGFGWPPCGAERFHVQHPLDYPRIMYNWDTRQTKRIENAAQERALGADWKRQVFPQLPEPVEVTPESRLEALERRVAALEARGNGGEGRASTQFRKKGE